MDTQIGEGKGRRNESRRERETIEKAKRPLGDAGFSQPAGAAEGINSWGKSSWQTSKFER
jgi:hypothetical protein